MGEWRGRDADAGGVLAPLTVDAGVLMRQRPGVDFYSIYHAGALVLAGESPYAGDAAGIVRVPYFTEYRYPPVTAFWLAAPLNLLPAGAAYVGWVVLLWLLPIAGFLWSLSERPDSPLLLGLIWFAWFPLVSELHLGQFTLAMAMLLLLFVLLLEKNRELATAPWVFACLIKVYPVAMALPLLLWRHRFGPLAAVLLLVVPTVPFLLPIGGSAAGTGAAGGVVDKVFSGAGLPYAGAQGLQAAMNALLWKARGRSFDAGESFTAPTRTADPVVWLNACLVLAMAGVCLWTAWRTRRGFHLGTIGLYWLVWFVAFRDCWEHHYMLLQPLAALLFVRGVIGARVLALVWLAAGAPSLWWLWQRSGYAGNPLAEALGLLYFLQRPVAVLLLAAACIRAVQIHPDPDAGTS